MAKFANRYHFDLLLNTAKSIHFLFQKKMQALEYSLLDERERMMAQRNRKNYQLIEKLTEECTAK